MFVDIIKYIKSNQLSIIGKLAPLKLSVARLKNWVEIFKCMEDNQLLTADRLASSGISQCLVIPDIALCFVETSESLSAVS